MLTKVTDPFITSSKLKKVGLGLPLLKQNAELTGGSLRIHSDSYKGTCYAVFSNIHLNYLCPGMNRIVNNIKDMTRNIFHIVLTFLPLISFNAMAISSNSGCFK